MPINPIITNIVKGWNVEARLEDVKYFYSYDVVDKILQNKKSYIIGRKGSGKSAICQHIASIEEYSVFPTKLSFKSFPFNFIYEMEDHKYRHPNQYIRIWQYIIYSSILKQMSRNYGVDEEVRLSLENIFRPKESIALAREIKNWTAFEFGASCAGTGGSVAIERTFRPNGMSWSERVDVMEDLIRDYAGTARYYIVFDELDEDYQDISDENNFKVYIDLLTGLFKAVQEVKSLFKTVDGFHIMPVVFLRDDIYAQIPGGDKNKWSDLKIDLEWNTDRLKSLLAFRIKQDDPMPRKGHIAFETEWNSLFETKKIRYGEGKNKEISVFEYISRSTLLRPRDFIKYIKSCCEIAQNRGSYFITEDIIRDVDRAFSNYFLEEFRDELTPILPDFDRIVRILSNQRQWIFSPESFKQEYVQEKELGNIREPNVDKVLETLYNFSVIGIQNKNIEHVHYFKYIHTNMAYNRREQIVIHRGLFKALGIQ